MAAESTKPSRFRKEPPSWDGDGGEAPRFRRRGCRLRRRGRWRGRASSLPSDAETATVWAISPSSSGAPASGTGVVAGERRRQIGTRPAAATVFQGRCGHT
uniref:Uncharacterized protein n=1 Tax=Arundo donax TaxID=35708 RepID=A0A0A9BY94_ARUDO